MSKQRIQLSAHFTYSRLLRFVLPCIGTMLFTSISGIVDGRNTTKEEVGLYMTHVGGGKEAGERA